jgi:hypothetical protein
MTPVKQMVTVIVAVPVVVVIEPRVPLKKLID